VETDVTPVVFYMVVVDQETGKEVRPPWFERCSEDVVPETMLSFLQQRLGDPIEAALMSTPRHPRLEVGWIFPGEAFARIGVEVPSRSNVLVTPMLRGAIVRAGGADNFVKVRYGEETLVSMFEVMADERLRLEQMANAGTGPFRSVGFLKLPPREYRPKGEQAGEE
jgi:hypothetical protein